MGAGGRAGVRLAIGPDFERGAVFGGDGIWETK
jgi:hypothetical protein